MSLTHPADAAQPPHHETGFNLLSSLREVVCAPDIKTCHDAIASAMRHLEQETAFHLMAAEAVLSLQGAAILWQDGHAPDGDGLLEDWFVHARNHPAQLLDFGGAGMGMAVAGGKDSDAGWIVMVADGDPPPFLRMAMHDLAMVAARHLQQLRHSAQARQLRLRLDADDGLNAGLVRASADLVWEADGEGALHITHIFHDRSDLACLLEGRRLDELRVGAGTVRELLASGERLRFQRMTASGIAEDLFVTASPVSGNRPLCGTISAGAPVGERLTLDAATLETIMGARQREEQLRRETEAMMLGLRLLLGDLSFREKLEQLAHHLTRAIDCDEVRLLQVRPGEPPRLVLPDAVLHGPMPKLEGILALADLRPVTVFPNGQDDNVFLARMLGMRGGDIALITLPSQGERHYLLCRARSGLTSADKGVAERIALLLQQALLLQADQQRMVHTAKLSALGQMSTSIAHELRQPLNTISIAAQNIELMVEMDRLDPAVLTEKSARILSQVERACKVMDRMRRFGRKTAGDHVPVSLAAIARSARSLMDKVTGETGIAIEVAVADEIAVFADELEIEQVLVNLIQNAADAIHEKGKAGRICLSTAGHPGDAAMVQLQVQDNGPGFPPDVLKHALDAFFTTKPQGQGTGLGLSIAHSILREHGGRLLVGNGESGGLVTLVLRRADSGIVPRAAE